METGKDFIELGAVQQLLRDYKRPWFFCGGWAIDLFLGYKSREHSDVEVGIFREDQAVLQEYLTGHKLYAMDKGEKREWKDGEFIELPVHEILIENTSASLEVLLNEKRGTEWLFRRNMEITLPVERLILWRDNMPFLCPEVALLYKARHKRPKDERDLESALPYLDTRQNSWLKSALIRTDVLHPWLRQLYKR